MIKYFRGLVTRIFQVMLDTQVYPTRDRFTDAVIVKFGSLYESTESVRSWSALKPDLDDILVDPIIIDARTYEEIALVLFCADEHTFNEVTFNYFNERNEADYIPLNPTIDEVVGDLFDCSSIELGGWEVHELVRDDAYKSPLINLMVKGCDNSRC